MDLSQRIAAGWQARGPAAVLLLPLAGLFALAVNVRRRAYRLGWLPSVRLPVPVLVVGNITAGGSGKTPLVLYLAQELARHGFDLAAYTAEAEAGYAGPAPGWIEPAP